MDWEHTKNLYIEGDNLEVLKLLQTAYYRKVKMIYIDPPYNTGNDFVYADDFADPISRYKEITQQTTKSNPETMGRYHTNWLNMMYPRLRLAANLLRDDGVIFISIDDNEVDNLKKLCNEVFGEENFINQFVLISFFYHPTFFRPAPPTNEKTAAPKGAAIHYAVFSFFLSFFSTYLPAVGLLPGMVSARLKPGIRNRAGYSVSHEAVSHRPGMSRLAR